MNCAEPPISTASTSHRCTTSDCTARVPVYPYARFSPLLQSKACTNRFTCFIQRWSSQESPDKNGRGFHLDHGQHVHKDFGWRQFCPLTDSRQEAPHAETHMISPKTPWRVKQRPSTGIFICPCNSETGLFDASEYRSHVMRAPKKYYQILSHQKRLRQIPRDFNGLSDRRKYCIWKLRWGRRILLTRYLFLKAQRDRRECRPTEKHETEWFCRRKKPTATASHTVEGGTSITPGKTTATAHAVRTHGPSWEPLPGLAPASCCFCALACCCCRTHSPHNFETVTNHLFHYE